MTLNFGMDQKKKSQKLKKAFRPQSNVVITESTMTNAGTAAFGPRVIFSLTSAF
jgi:hypothetical protein